MRKFKLTLFSLAFAAVELVGTASAQGYLRAK